MVIFNQAYEIRQWKPHRHEAVRNRPEMVRFQPVEPEAERSDFSSDSLSGRDRTGGSDLIEGWFPPRLAVLPLVHIVGRSMEGGQLGCGNRR
jgi:hypothetical protein